MWKTEGSETVRIARVLRPHGVRGAVVLGIDESMRAGLAPGLEVEVERLGTLTLASASPHKNGLLVKFEGVDSRDTAEDMAGNWVTVARASLPANRNGQFYDFELIGAELKNGRDGTHLGTVREVIRTAANDVYLAEGPAGELLVPAIEGVVLDIDSAGGVITVDPTGMVISPGSSGGETDAKK